MSVYGNTSGWEDFFPDGLVAEVLGLIMECWDNNSKPSRTELEVPITRRFREALIRDKNARRLPFTIWPESSETDSVTGKEIGRIDIRFLHGHYERVYLAFECKRLRIVGRKYITSNVNAYVGDEGMMRHVTGKYSKGLRDAGMIGYVMDGNVESAKTAVRKAIVRHAVKLCADANSPLVSSRHITRDLRIVESEHVLNSGSLTIHHILLAV